MQRIRYCLALLIAVISMNLAGCDTPQANSGDSRQATPAATTPASSPSSPQATKLPRLEGKATVVITVNKLPITIEVDGTNAPITAGNFVDLVQRGVYNNTAFHRVVKSPEPFVVQGGDPQSKDSKVPKSAWGTGNFVDPDTNKPRYVPLEIKPKGAEQPIYSRTFEMAGVDKPPQLRHTRGAVAMARSNFPDSASAQFYFALSELPFLDGSYAVFGYATPESMAVVDQIKQGDIIESAQVTQGLENLKK